MYYDLVHYPLVIHYVSKSKPWNYNRIHTSMGDLCTILKRASGSQQVVGCSSDWGSIENVFLVV